jgi:hypothetical protein
MKPIKSEQIAFRVSPEEKTEIEEIATQMKTTAGALASALLEEFVSAKKKHGKRLIWPPEFNYFTNSETEQDAQDKRDASAKAG